MLGRYSVPYFAEYFYHRSRTPLMKAIRENKARLRTKKKKTSYRLILFFLKGIDGRGIRMVYTGVNQMKVRKYK